MTDQREREQSNSEVRSEAASSWRGAFENSLIWIKPHHWLLWLVAMVLVVLLGIGTAFLVGIFSDGDNDPPRQETAEQVGPELAPPAPDAELAPSDEPDPDPVVAAPDPAESAADDDDTTFASVAGVYRLQERSLRVAVEPFVERFLSADGVIVIEPDGSVSGEYSYTYSETGLDTRTDTNFVTEVTNESTIDPATTPRLEETDIGLSFEATMVLAFVADPSIGEPYVTPGTSYDVTGLLDPESSLLELTVPGQEFALDFLR